MAAVLDGASAVTLRRSRRRLDRRRTRRAAAPWQRRAGGREASRSDRPANAGTSAASAVEDLRHRGRPPAQPGSSAPQHAAERLDRRARLRRRRGRPREALQPPCDVDERALLLGVVATGRATSARLRQRRVGPAEDDQEPRPAQPLHDLGIVAPRRRSRCRRPPAPRARGAVAEQPRRPSSASARRRRGPASSAPRRLGDASRGR